MKKDFFPFYHKTLEFLSKDKIIAVGTPRFLCRRNSDMVVWPEVGQWDGALVS